MNVESSSNTLSVTVPVSGVADLVLKPLQWEESKNTFGLPRFDAHVLGRYFTVNQFEDNVWQFKAGNDVSKTCANSEDAFAAAEDHYKAWVHEFVSATVEGFAAPLEALLPEEPSAPIIRALFTLNSGTPRSTAEVTQVYRSIRNLAARAEEGLDLMMDEE